MKRYTPLLACFLFFLLLLPAWQAQAQTRPSLAEPAENHRASLQTAQRDRLNRVESQDFARNVRLLQLRNPADVLVQPEFDLMLEPGRTVRATTRGVTRHDDGTLTWLGHLGDDPEFFSLTVREGEVQGRLRAGDTTYLLEPVGAGYHALYTLDRSKLPPTASAALVRNVRRETHVCSDALSVSISVPCLRRSGIRL